MVRPPSSRVRRFPSAAPAHGARAGRGPLLASAVLHAAAFVVLARVAVPPTTPAALSFEVRVASVEAVAADPVEPLEPERPAAPDAPEPPPAFEPPSDPAPDAPPPPDDEVPPELFDELGAIEARDADPVGELGPVGPSAASVVVRRPAPPALAASAAPPSPPPAPPSPPVTFRPPVAVAATAASVASSAVEGARPDAGNAPPVYPADARAQRHTGVVTLRIDVDATGAVRAVAVATSSGHASLDAAAVEAARGWRFSPARRDGVPFASAVLRRVRFVLGA